RLDGAPVEGAEPFAASADGRADSTGRKENTMRKKHTGRALVIQIGEADIRIAGTSLGASAPQLSYSTVIPTPEGAVEDGAILDPEALQEALRGPLSAPEIQRIRKAVFVLCSTQVLSGTAAVPPGAERQMDKLLSANADLYFPVDTADY